MPRYARKSRRPRTYKKSRSRFKRKRFARNGINQLSMRAPLASRLLRVKLPWVETENISLANNVPNSICFQGNALCPTTVAGLTGANSPAAGDTIASGAIEYSNFYDRYVINGSSIKIEIVNRAVSSPADPNITVQSGIVRAALLAIPFTAHQGGNDTWQQVRAQLDGYSYEQLLAWPYAKWRMVAANSGGASRLIFKMFRKTKSMCGLKDLRDNERLVSLMPDNGSTSITNGVTNPTTGFMYYLRLFPESASGASNNQSVAITTRMSLYTTMFSREFNPIRTLT